MLMMSAKPIAPDADAATEWWFDDSPHDSWRRFYGAWEASGLPGLKKRPIGPPEAFVVRCHTPGWIAEAVDGIPRIRGKPYFATPPSIWQVLKDPDFFTKLANGAYDAAPAAKKTRAEIERDERKAIVQAVSLRLQEGERA